MSGVFGCLGSVSEQTFDQMRANLLHRGAAECSVTRAGGIRLACRTNEFVASASEIPLVYSGRIVNRAELAGLLGSAVPPATHAADRQLLWNLYCQFGTRGFERINGTFAIAIADAESQSLLLTVDRWAVQPLYFVRAHGKWLFASECKALFAAMSAQSELDPSVAEYVSATKYLPVQRTLDANIRAVGPGQWVRIHAGAAEVGSYSPFRLETIDDAAEERCARELRECILTAAKRLIEPHERVGIALSGGLDSVLTVGAVRHVAPRIPIYTYTAAFDSRDPVFTKARKAAEYFSTVHREIVIDAGDLARLLPEMMWRMEDPVAREEMLVYHMVSQRAATEVPVVLYGHMADMLFGGMPRHMLIKLASDLRLARRPLMQFYDYTQSGKPPTGLIARLLVTAYSRGRRVRPPRPLSCKHSLQAKSIAFEAKEPFNAALLSGLAYPSEISAIERLHAWSNVELGSIFHDRDVAACAFRIPGHMKIRGRSRKHILRVAAQGILPAEFAERSKDLIRIKRDDRLRSVVQQLSDQLLSADALHRRALFDPEDVRALCRLVDRKRCPYQAFYHLWTLLLIEIWCRTFLDDAWQPYGARQPSSSPLQKGGRRYCCGSRELMIPSKMTAGPSAQ